MFLFLKANMCVSKQFAIKLLSHRVNHPDYPSYTLTSIFHFNYSHVVTLFVICLLIVNFVHLFVFVGFYCVSPDLILKSKSQFLFMSSFTLFVR